MKVSRKILLFLMSAIVAFQMFGCAQNGLESVGKSLTTYHITATYDETEKKLTASQTVEYVNESDVELNEVWFHLYPSAYRENSKFMPVELKDVAYAYPSGISYGGITVSGVTVEGQEATNAIGGEDENILMVTLPKSILPGAKVKIGMNFELKLPNMRHRLGYVGSTVNLGNWYPVACVYENGAFDATPYYSNGDPFYLKSANFNVSITAPKKYTVAASGKSTRVESGENATTVSSCLAARDFALVLGEFQVLSGDYNGKAIYYYYVNDEEAQKNLTAATDAIKTFSEKFYEYPYETFSVVQTPFLHGGMEYTGLIYASDALSGELYRDAIIHEAAHQWWYGLVGNNQIVDSWLDEALTEYTTTLFYDLNSEYNIKYADRISDALSGYVVFCEINKEGLDTSMNRRLNEYRSGLEYTYMTYVKGQLLFDTLRKTIGLDALYAGLKDYATTYAFKTAKPDDLIGCIEKSSKVQLKSLFENWVTGKVLIFGGNDK